MKFGDREFPYSFSQDRTYEECPRKYKFKYVDGIKEPASSYATAGSLVHELFEKFFDMTETELVEKQKQIDEAFVPGYSEKVILEWLEYLRDTEILGKEIEIKTDNFVGYIDLLLLDKTHKYTPNTHNYADNLIIVDYKVTKKPKTVQSIYNEGQLLVYKEILGQLHPEFEFDNIYVQYLNILPYMAPKVVSYTQAEFVQSPVCHNRYENLLNNVRLIETGHFEKRTKWCNWCYYKDMCDKE